MLCIDSTQGNLSGLVRSTRERVLRLLGLQRGSVMSSQVVLHLVGTFLVGATFSLNTFTVTPEGKAYFVNPKVNKN